MLRNIVPKDLLYTVELQKNLEFRKIGWFCVQNTVQLVYV